MSAFVIFILTQVSFAHVVRLNHRLRGSVPWAGAIAYTAGCIFSAVGWVISPEARMGWEEIVYGGIAGAGICAGYFLFNATVRMAGVGITQTAGRLSGAIPVVAAIVVWHETAGPVRVAGMLLAALAVPLLAGQSGRSQKTANPWTAPMLLILFTVMGITGVAFKAYEAGVAVQSRPVFLTAHYLVASVGSWLAVLRCRQRPSGRDVLVGAGLGALNVINKWAFMLALSALGAVVVFPVSTVAIIGLSVMASVVFWRERYTRRAVIGFVIAAAAIVLIGLKK